MYPRVPLVLVAVLASCDDTVFPPQFVEYEPNWTGVSAFCYAECRQCHDSIAQPLWPEALEVDVREGDQSCDGGGDCTSGRCGDDGTCEELYVVPGSPQDSYFWRVLSDADRQPGDLRMPANGSLPAEQIEFIEEWILAGAPL